jgi:hypothetical protein
MKTHINKIRKNFRFYQSINDILKEIAHRREQTQTKVIELLIAKEYAKYYEKS